MEVSLKKKCIFLLSTLVLVSAAFLMDAAVRAAVLHIEGLTWNESSTKRIVAAVSRYGDWPELMIIGAIGVLIARYRQSRRCQKIFLCAMLASTLAGAMANTLRLTTGRTRPRVTEQNWYGPYHAGKWTIGKSEFNSFPSGHTATAVGFATVILLASPFWGCVAMVLALSVAGSRLLLGAHHPSDLVTAVFLALAISWFLWYYIESRSPCWMERLIR